MQGLNWQTIQVPFTAGVNQQVDARALQPPELTIAKDVTFAEIGGLQTRYLYADAAGEIEGGGTLSNLRKIFRNGSELVAFTDTALYSKNAATGKWLLRGTHLAVKVEEEAKFITTGDQINADRAELDNVVIHAWEDDSTVYVAATDKESGAVIANPRAVASAGGPTRPRLVALDDKILLFTYNATGSGGASAGLVVRALDPADVTTGILSTPTDVLVAGGAVTSNIYYDVCRRIGSDEAIAVVRGNPTTSYRVATITGALVITTTNKARTCTGPIAVSCSPTGTQFQVVRNNGTDIQGDLITIASFVDVYTAQPLGTVLNTCQQIAAAHRSVQDSGQYRCHAFWSDGEQPVPNSGESQVKTNWIDTGNTISVQTVMVRALGVASRAFDHNGRVFVHCVFAGESDGVDNNVYGQPALLQNTYFLYRDDQTLHAKLAAGRAAGYGAVVGWLPGVVSTDTDTYSWCGGERRIISLGGNHKSYADRGPRDFALTFDSDEARRCVRLGRTLYITGGEILQYDGSRLTEVGFHIFPYFIEVSGTAGSLDAGAYFFKITPRWDNAQGETDRGTTATVGSYEVPGPGTEGVSMDIIGPLHPTHKTVDPIALEVWRTVKNPTDDSPYFLVSSKDPADTGSNGYLANDTSVGQLSFVDELVDGDAREGEENIENGGILESLAPPAATIIAASDTRVFLAGAAGDPDRVWYSKQRAEGEVASFHESLTVPVPGGGGPITAIAIMQGTPVVFRENASYALAGDGFDNGSGGQNYAAREVSPNIGALSQECVAVTDRGIVFHSAKGKYLLNKGWQLEYIGGPVVDYDNETPVAVFELEKQHQLRWLTSSRMLVLDTQASDVNNRPTWSEWTISDGLHAAPWDGGLAVLVANGVRYQHATWSNITDATLTFGIDVETAFIKLNDLQGFGRVRKIMLLGEYRSACDVRVRLARDGQTSYFQDKTITMGETVGDPLQFKIGPKIQQVQSLKVRITVTPRLTEEASSESLKLTGIALEVGIKPGLFPNLPAEKRI